MFSVMVELYQKSSLLTKGGGECLIRLPNFLIVLKVMFARLTNQYSKKTTKLRPCYTRQFFLQLVSQQTLRDKLQEGFHV